MGLLAEMVIMEKPRGRPKTSERSDQTVKIERGLATKARILAGHLGVSMAELLSDLLRGPLEKRYAQLVKEIDRKSSGD